MVKKICIVTGGNSGIGFEMCRGMAKAGFQVIMVSRGPERGELALEKLKAEFGDSVEMMLCDMSDLDNISKLYDEYTSKYDRLDVLLNNAGALWGSRLKTKQDNEMTFGVNHLGYFVMTETFLPLLKSTKNSRIINTSSEAHKMSKLNLANLNHENIKYSQWRTYCNSKLCNILFTRELARRLEGTGIKTHCFHPGVVRTRFAEEAKGLMRLFWPIFRIFMIGSKRGAKTGLHLALSEDAGKTTGEYWSVSKRRKGASFSRNENNAKKLWQISEDLLKK